jgi:hypothetical protein
MNKKSKLFLMFFVTAIFFVTSTAYATSVEPELKDWPGGDAANICTPLGYDFGYKIDGWENQINDGSYGPHFGQTITIENSNQYTFDWSVTPYPLGTVVVKGGGGTIANYYIYKDGNETLSDTGLVAPLNPNTQKTYEISNVTFCWNKSEACYQNETAWAEGQRYVSRGNWATYVEYEEEMTVNLYAGQDMLAGEATLAANNDNDLVKITIQLANGFIFYYDLNDEEADHNLKVQDYADEPAENPQPGRFKHKQLVPIGSTTASIDVPRNNFYGIHLDVAYEVPCE